MSILCGKNGKWPAAVVFDLDGTLVDSAADLAEALNTLMARKGLSAFSYQEVVGFIGNGISELVRRGLAARQVNPSADELAIEVMTFKDIYGDRLTKLTAPYDGVIDVISCLKAEGAKLGICTNKDEILANRIIDELGLRSHFDVVVGGSAGRSAKPAAAPLLEAIARLNVQPENAVMVGDSGIDFECAQNASVSFIGLTFGYSNPSLSALGAEVLIDHYSGFAAACRSLRRLSD